ncbi:MAG TPA: class I SAM-dependent methyltransferase [Acidimicrobiales bacterium]|nr:class I SAM-dependent methyltransferase [Acidimicrobiales bacterium]
MSRGKKLETMWNRRTATWHDHVGASTAFDHVRAAVLAEAAGSAGSSAVDLGAGTGFLTLALAPDVDKIIAVDVSPSMLDKLAADAAADGLENVRCLVADLAIVDLPEASVDLVVSSYALHHLRDVDKRALIVRTKRWLRPGGRLVVADMMFGRGATAQDRRILRSKVRSLVRKGPGGVWRIAKNLVRFGLRVGADRPVPPQFWVDALVAAGFGDVEYRPIVAEAGLVIGSA